MSLSVILTIILVTLLYFQFKNLSPEYRQRVNEFRLFVRVY